ncbi:hypothetical protein KAU33_10985 [Candidatus Dependentiae bacterium]|nr:hypothetical protein [Candidatus Dependentiae bacterium]
MKKGICFILIFGVLVCIFQFNCYAEQEQKLSGNENNKIEIPYFMPEGKNIREVINNKIYITECLYGNYIIPDKIYFSDGEVNLIKEICIFPKKEKRKKRINVKIFHSPKGKYIAFKIKYEIPTDKNDKNGYYYDNGYFKLKKEFKIFNEKGEIVFKGEVDDFTEIFLTDEGRLIIAYLHQGFIKIFMINGKYIKQTKLSDWKEIPYPEEEHLIFPTITMSQNGRYLVISRSSSLFDKNKICELMLIDIEGNIIWKKVDKGKANQFEGITRGHVNISRTGKYIISSRYDVISGNPYETGTGKYELKIEVFNNSGKLLWKMVIDKEGTVESDFTNDEEILKVWTNTGKEYIFEIKSGKIISEKIKEKQNK